MFNKEEIEMLESRITELEMDIRIERLSLSRLKEWIKGTGRTQQRILDYLDIELKTTPEKTELVKNVNDKVKYKQ